MTSSGGDTASRPREWTREALPIVALLMLSSLALFRLRALPAFEDEGTQIRWISRVIEAGEWLQPLAEGRPLQVWPMVLPVWLGGDPLMVLRASNVLLGMVGAVLTYRVALRFGDRLCALSCGVLFAICPFVVCLQRLALADMLLCVSGQYVVLGTLKLVESPTTARATLLAASLVVASFSKLPVGFIFVFVMPAALWFLAPERRLLLRPPARQRLLLSQAPVGLLGVLVMLVAGVRMWRGKLPGFGLQTLAGVGLGNDDIAKGYGVVGMSLGTELAAQLSWPAVLIGAAGVVWTIVRGDARQRWLAALGVVPMLGIGLGARFWFSRYLLFTLPPLIISSVVGWTSVLRHARWAGTASRVGGVSLFGACSLLMGYQSVLVVTDPLAASWSRVDRIQYIEGGGSGYGYPEAARYVLASGTAPATIYSLDGHSAYQLRCYLPPSWQGRVRPIFFGKDGDNLRTEAQRRAQLIDSVPTWVIAPELSLDAYLEASFGPAASRGLALRQIAAFEKPGSRTRLTMHEVVRRSAAE